MTLDFGETDQSNEGSLESVQITPDHDLGPTSLIHGTIFRSLGFRYHPPTDKISVPVPHNGTWPGSRSSP